MRSLAAASLSCIVHANKGIINDSGPMNYFTFIYYPSYVPPLLSWCIGPLFLSGREEDGGVDRSPWGAIVIPASG